MVARRRCPWEANRRGSWPGESRLSACDRQTIAVPVTSLRLITPISLCRLLLLFGVRVERNVPSFTLQMVMAVEDRVMGQDLRIYTWRGVIGSVILSSEEFDFIIELLIIRSRNIFIFPSHDTRNRISITGIGVKIYFLLRQNSVIIELITLSEYLSCKRMPRIFFFGYFTVKKDSSSTCLERN